MKITQRVVDHFESEQEQYGTKVALSNLLWQVAAEMLANIGVKKLKTSYKARG
jgi:hypothetical protein